MLSVYIHKVESIHLSLVPLCLSSSPAQLCASHEEETVDLNTRLSAQRRDEILM